MAINREDKTHSKPVTMSTVARHARLSRTTVSKVINKSGFAKPETIARVHEAIREVGYIPNEAARSLVRRRSYTVGAVFDWDFDFWAMEILRAVEPLLQREGYSLVAYPNGSISGNVHQCLNSLISWRVDAVLSFVNLGREALEELSARNVTVVNWGFPSADLPGLHYVCTDIELGCSRIANYLVRLGHRQIGYMLKQATSAEEEIYLQIRNILARLEPDARINILGTSDNTIAAGAETISRIDFSAPDRPTAILCRTDNLAFGALSGLSGAGLRVPEDISIIGINDDRTSAYTIPPLTTLRIPSEAVAKYVVEAALGGLKGEEMPKFQLIKPELVVRDSTGPAPNHQTNRN